MIASITMRPCSNTSGAACTTTIKTAPGGWTQVGTTIDQTTGAGTGGYGHRLAIYRRVATGAEPASYTWSFGGTPLHAGAVGAISSFSGVDTANPIVANAGQVTAAAATHVAPTINTSPVTNTMLVSTFSANSSGTWTPPASMTERADVASLAVPNDLGLSIEQNTQAIPAAGLTGTRTATQSSPPANDTGATYSLALRPGITVTHYSISVLASTVANCDYAEVTIVGHDATHAPVNVPSSRTVTLTTSTGTGVWQAGLVAGTGTWLPSGAKLNRNLQLARHRVGFYGAAAAERGHQPDGKRDRRHRHQRYRPRCWFANSAFGYPTAPNGPRLLSRYCGQALQHRIRRAIALSPGDPHI